MTSSRNVITPLKIKNLLSEKKLFIKTAVFLPTGGRCVDDVIEVIEITFLFKTYWDFTLRTLYFN